MIESVARLATAIRSSLFFHSGYISEFIFSVRRDKKRSTLDRIDPVPLDDYSIGDIDRNSWAVLPVTSPKDEDNARVQRNK